MGIADPAVRDSFRDKLSSALNLASGATTKKRQKAKNKIFGIWEDFCQRHGHHGTLGSLLPEARFNFLLVFGILYRQRGQKGQSVRSGTVRNALSAVCKGITDLDQPDPRINPSTNQQYPVLDDFYRAMDSKDDPASRAYPVNITILKDGKLDNFNYDEMAKMNISSDGEISEGEVSC